MKPERMASNAELGSWITYTAQVSYKSVTETFKVAGYDEQWCAVRAISHFFHRHPELNRWENLSFKDAAEEAKSDGLKIGLIALVRHE